MKTTTAAIIGICLVMAAMIYGFSSCLDSHQKQIKELKQTTVDLKTEVRDLKTARTLEARVEWYYHERETVSSEPDGKGERVSFKLPGLYVTKYPWTLHNKRITFTRTQPSSIDELTTAGGLLEMNVDWRKN